MGLDNANLTKLMLCEKIKEFLPEFEFEISSEGKDPDQRDYFVSNKKIEKKGFKATIKIEDGINELIKVFTHNKEKIINNY